MNNEQMLITLRKAAIFGNISDDLRNKINELDKRICDAHSK